MRTSPPGMRRFSRRAPSALLLSLALVATTAAACSDDGGDDDTSPTTTSPTTTEAAEGGDGEETTTTEDAPATTTTTEAPESSDVPPPAHGEEVALSAAEAEAVIGDLLSRLREVLAEAKAAGDDVELVRAGFTEVFNATEAADQFDGINEFGGLPVVRPDPGEPSVDAVEVVGGSGTCVTGTAEIDLDPLMTRPIDALQPYSFRLQPAGDGAPGPAWRLSYMGFVRDRAYTENAACPA